MFGFFSISTAIDSVLGLLLTMPTGTTAPFWLSGVWKNDVLALDRLAAAQRLHRIGHALGIEGRFVPRLGRRVPRLEPARGGHQRKQRHAAARLQYLPASAIHSLPLSYCVDAGF
jgi:hypothetical protein